jgi:hypothetical protein
MNYQRYWNYHDLYAADERSKGRKPMDYAEFVSVGLPRIAKLYTKDWQLYLFALNTGIPIKQMDEYEFAMTMQYDFDGYRKRLYQRLMEADERRTKAEAERILKEQWEQLLKNRANKEEVSRVVERIMKRLTAQNKPVMTKSEMRIAQRKRLEAIDKRARNKRLANAETNANRRAMISQINTYGSVLPNLPTDVLRMLRTELTGRNSQKTPRAQAQRDVERAFNNMGVRM